ncbi:peptidase U32 family protein [Carboxylicivirga linearis]|uniref:U32 family peptidase n=1 Tax=Carboxylicivirga linearis TaxID=1628157 RepID=A0ABS5K030_9BACT|nr:U32 family peptidase [Carboxylicivirga linearis]MBS2100515.1 U32 family peptidase [Carboxylicivirga linearis]
MNINKRHIELLSPAKNLECGLAAINNGADAVYIGGPGFGARKQAGNSLEDIEKLIKHAHLFNAKIYITLNTVLKDSEIEEANQLIHSLYKIGADAVIIQDMGLLETDLPPIPIHASTQTDNRTVEKVQFLEKAGFDQVVLARELSVNQIKNISSQTQVPLEYFIHGALCVCYSGQCYMSASINGRSANRGECAQPCRLKYSLKDKDGNLLYKDKHLLSLKDLNQTPNLEELIDAGITSFKIEGRLKSKDYVANVTAHYRKELDRIMAKRTDINKASSGNILTSFTPAPDKSFNRSFTEYFLHDRDDKVWSIDTPKALGEYIGKISKVGKDFFTIDGSTRIANGDGLCFFDQYKNLVGVRVNTSNGNKIFSNQTKGLKQGTDIYRNNDVAFQQAISKKESERKIALDLILEETEEVLKLTLIDEDGISSSSFKELSEKEVAQNKERLASQTEKQLSKLGNTPYVAQSIQMNHKYYWFVPAAILNELRRSAIENHTNLRLQSYQPKNIEFKKTDHPFIKTELDFKANITNQLAKQFYERHGVTQLDWGFEKQAIKNNVEVMTTKHCLLYMTNKCLKFHPEARKYLPLTLFNKQDTYKLQFDCKACEMHIIKK